MNRILIAILLLASIFFVSSCEGTAGPAESAAAGANEISLGMGLDDFRHLVPSAYQDAGNKDRWIVNADVSGLEGKWTYFFNKGTLRWYVFNASEYKVSRQAFDQYLRVTNDLVRRYEKESGKARKVRRGIQEYQDPATRSHNGYMVQQVTWEGPEGKRTVEFSFLGDHRNYSLMLSIQVGQ